MAEWFTDFAPHAGQTHIHFFSNESLGNGVGWTTPSSIAWPSANLAMFIPFRISTTASIANVFTLNGATASGNLDIGIYDASGTRLASTGSTAQSGTNAIQQIALSVTLSPGQFFIALALSNTTGTFFMGNPAANVKKIVGIREQASALPLPAVATFATAANSYVPVVGLTTRSVI